ncbi:MAG: rRNA (guanine966-N2)-methyltransferase, partial [Patescibacteria group bacterium]|nr:rRNA (guanine966-N2)-methyltransferase [Patescibacteria group bacterium]
VTLEIDYDAYEVIGANAETLGITEKINLQHINARSWSYRNNTERFDIVFCDPPYNQLQETILEKLAKHAQINGILVYSMPPHGDIRLPEDKYELITTKTYGDAMLAFYRKIS